MAIERITVGWPDGFDPGKHSAALVARVNQKRGGGFEMGNIDPVARTATLLRQSIVVEVSSRRAAGGRESFEVDLPRGTKPTDGPRIAARFEDQFEGYRMTRFEPFLGTAELTRLEPATIRCRGAAALALGCKEWDVQVTPRQDGGFDITLPKTYMPSKHDGKLTEVAEAVVGRIGWYWTADAKALTGSIIPSEPPTFPPVLPTPMTRLRQDDWNVTPIGRVLPDPGQDLGREVAIDWAQAADLLIAGLPGGGKSVVTNAIIASQLASSVSVCVIDVPSKAVDYLWCKKFLHENFGWGCDSLAQAVTVLVMIYEEGQRRAKVLANEGVVKWLDLPKGKQFPPILVVVDEVTGLLTVEKAPAGIPKDHPLVVEAVQHNLLVATLNKYIHKITAELRFVGVRMVLSSQVTNDRTGIGPSLKAKLGHHILQGVNPSESARKQAFNDASSVPTVPGNVRADGDASRGVGTVELEGFAPSVYKGFYASPEDYAGALETLDVPTTRFPEPTDEQIARCTPSIEDSTEQGDGGRRESAFGDDGQTLRGAAAANHAHRVQMAQAKQQRKRAAPVTRKSAINPDALDICPACETAIDPQNGCLCSR